MLQDKNNTLPTLFNLQTKIRILVCAISVNTNDGIKFISFLPKAIFRIWYEFYVVHNRNVATNDSLKLHLFIHVYLILLWFPFCLQVSVNDIYDYTITFFSVYCIDICYIRTLFFLLLPSQFVSITVAHCCCGERRKNEYYARYAYMEYILNYQALARIHTLKCLKVFTHFDLQPTKRLSVWKQPFIWLVAAFCKGLFFVVFLLFNLENKI